MTKPEQTHATNLLSQLSIQYSRLCNVFTGMDTTLAYNALMAEQDKRIAETVTRERGRLANFIRRRVPDASEAEDILQDVFYEFVQAYRQIGRAHV